MSGHQETSMVFGEVIFDPDVPDHSRTIVGPASVEIIESLSQTIQELKYVCIDNTTFLKLLIIAHMGTKEKCVNWSLFESFWFEVTVLLFSAFFTNIY